MRRANSEPTPGTVAMTASGATFASKSCNKVELPLVNIPDHGGDAVANSRERLQLLHLVVLCEFRDALIAVAHRLRAFAIGADAERVGILRFEQIGNPFEEGGDVSI